MRRRATRGNRTGHALIGLPLLVAGAAVLARSAGLYGGPATAPLYSAAAHRYIHDHGWIWPAVAAAAIIIGLACLRWLIVQPRRDLLRRVRLDSDHRDEPGAGRTILLADAVTNVIDSDLAAQRGVRRAAAALSGQTDQPELWLTLTAAADIDLARLRDHLTSELLPSLRTSLAQPGLTAYLRITITRRTRHDHQGVLAGETTHQEPPRPVSAPRDPNSNPGRRTNTAARTRSVARRTCS
jgi:hypothetical protein